MAAIALCFAATAYSQDESVKQVEQLVKKAKATVEAVGNTKVQLSKTMEVYNGLMAEGNTDRKGAYKKLQHEIATTDERRATIAARSAEMDAEADTVFKSWSDSTNAIEDPTMRKRSEERLANAKKSLATVKAAGDKASDGYVTVMKNLQDQVTYLGHDLNPSAIASLKPEQDKLNHQVQELTKRTDDAVSTANSAISAINPTPNQ
jgi:hypothetical protein